MLSEVPAIPEGTGECVCGGGGGGGGKKGGSK